MESYIDGGLFSIDDEYEEDKMSQGDIVLFRTNDLEGKIIRKATDSEWTHMGMMISNYRADSIGKYGRRRHYLRRLKPEIEDYLILEHQNINPLKRKQLMTLNRRLPTNYDLISVVDVGLREMFGKRNNIDISNPVSFYCSSRIGYMFNILDLPIKKDIHWSQYIPKDFAESEYFREK